MSDQHTKEPQQQQKDNQPQATKGGPPKKVPRTKLQVGSAGLLYLVSLIITAVAAANIFIPVPPTCRDQDFMILTACQGLVASSSAGPAVFVGAVLVQILLSAVFSIVKDPRWQKWTYIIEVYIINLLGIYWLVCVKLEYLPGLRDIGRAVGKAMTVGTILGIAAVVFVAIMLHAGPKKLWDATPQQQGGPRR